MEKEFVGTCRGMVRVELDGDKCSMFLEESGDLFFLSDSHLKTAVNLAISQAHEAALLDSWRRATPAEPLDGCTHYEGKEGYALVDKAVYEGMQKELDEFRAHKKKIDDAVNGFYEPYENVDFDSRFPSEGDLGDE